MRRITRTAAVLLATALIAAACGTEEDDPGVIDDPLGADDPVEAEDDPADAEDAGDVTVLTGDTELGEVLVDGDGLTLYLFDPDEQGASTCYDDCADNWPPLLGEPAAGDGVDEGLLATTERDDGAVQATYDGWPLYHWIGDEAPGDVAGQGVQDVWWVVAPDGTPLRDTAMDDDDEDDDEDDEGMTGY